MKPWLGSLSIPGWMSAQELEWLYELGRDYQGTIVEVGSYFGRSSTAILKGIVDSGYRADLICVDAYLQDRTQVPAFGRFPSVALLEEELAKVSPSGWQIYNQLSVDAAKEFADDGLAAVFIDADHDYESIKADLLAWMPKVGKHGMLCGHDYSRFWPDVPKAVDELVGRVGTVDAIWYRLGEP